MGGGEGMGEGEGEEKAEREAHRRAIGAIFCLWLPLKAPPASRAPPLPSGKGGALLAGGAFIEARSRKSYLLLGGAPPFPLSSKEGKGGAPPSAARPTSNPIENLALAHTHAHTYIHVVEKTTARVPVGSIRTFACAFACVCACNCVCFYTSTYDHTHVCSHACRFLSVSMRVHIGRIRTLARVHESVYAANARCDCTM